MDWTADAIPFSEIDSNDDAFRVTTRECDAALADSVEHLGILSPPAVIRGDDSLRIISGFRRIEACRTIGLKTLPVRILSEKTPLLTCVEIAITENSFQRTLNVVEQSRAVRLLMDHAPSNSALRATAARVGIGGNPDHWSKLARLCSLPETLQEGLISGAISLPVAVELDAIPKGLAKRFAEIIMELGLSLNRQRDLITTVREIGAREDKLPLDILDEPGFRKILRGTEKDRKQRSRNLAEYLKKRRYPAITAAEQHFHRHTESLNLPDAFVLIPPRGFESLVYTLQIRFKTPEDLDRSVRDLKTLSNHPDLKKLTTK